MLRCPPDRSFGRGRNRTSACRRQKGKSVMSPLKWLASLSLLTAALVPATASAQPAATFSYQPTAPIAGQAVTFNAPNADCDAAPCTFTWTDDGPDGPGGTSWPLGSGQTLKYTFSG